MLLETVKDLIEALKEIKDKNKPIRVIIDNKPVSFIDIDETKVVTINLIPRL